nr:MAG TPA: hypothetical protein [Caudoviricetes sp.]
MNRTFVRFFYYHLTQLSNLKIILKNFQQNFLNSHFLKHCLESASVPLLELCY